MNLKLSELEDLKNGESLRQKVDEILACLREKNIAVDILELPPVSPEYSGNTLTLQLCVSIPARKP